MSNLNHVRKAAGVKGLDKTDISVYNPETYPMIYEGDRTEIILGYAFPILTWPEIEERYPSSCIIYTNDTDTRDERCMIGTVISVCDRDFLFEETKRFNLLGISTGHYQTSLPDRRY